jgi:hypothetical protein
MQDSGGREGFGVRIDGAPNRCRAVVSAGAHAGVVRETFRMAVQLMPTTTQRSVTRGDASSGGAGMADASRALTAPSAPAPAADDRQHSLAARRRRFGARTVFRLLGTIATVLSLIICCASAVFWARGLMAAEGFVARYGTGFVSISSTDGVVVTVVQRILFDSPEAEQRYREWADPFGSMPWNQWRFYVLNDTNATPAMSDAVAGFGFQRLSGQGGRRVGLRGVTWYRVMVQTPHWAIILLTCIAPAMRLYRSHRVRRDRLDQGLCLKCGFAMGDVYHSCPVCGERRPIGA